MSFQIDAYIENGQPAVRILDADSQAVRLAWCRPAGEAPCSGPEGPALQRLFRELFLLSLLDKLNPERVAAKAAPTKNAHHHLKERLSREPANRYNP